MIKTSVFGATGFIGNRYCQMYPDETIGIHKDIICPETDHILYLISTTHNYHIYDDPFLDINTNLSSLMSVLNCMQEIRRFYKHNYIFNFVSSWFVYGQTNDLPAKENSYCNPKGFYSITKRCAEQLLISYCETFDIPYRIFRLANVYGIGDKPTAKKNALQYLIGKLAKNEDVDLYNGGNVIRDYIHVDDVCRALHTLMDSAPLDYIINVGSGKPYKIGNLIRYAKDRLGSISKIGSIDLSEFHKTIQVKDMYLDVNLAKRYGMENQISIEQGLDEYIEWLKSNNLYQ